MSGFNGLFSLEERAHGCTNKNRSERTTTNDVASQRMAMTESNRTQIVLWLRTAAGQQRANRKSQSQSR